MSDSTVRKSTRVLVVSSILGALVVILGITHIGFIPWLAGASLTIMHIPVIIAAILEGPLAGLIVGAIFGLFSMLQAIIGPTGVLDPLFANPLISVLPRLLIGPAAWLVWQAFRGKRVLPASLLSGLAGSLTNTVLVLGALKLLMPMRQAALGIGNGLRGLLGMQAFAQEVAAGDLSFFSWKLIWGVFLANGLPEAALAAIITMLVILTWKKIGPSGTSRLSRETEAK